jgi:HAD superfamily phosphoserine phosphatase-like hydrolase
MRIAIYDLDRTLTRRSTFTPFLMFAAARIAPWRLLFAPLWVAMMVAHKLGVQDRTTLKRHGMALMLGRPDSARLLAVAEDFAAKRACQLHPGAERALAEDRRADCTIAIATAAFALYAQPIARHLGIEHVIATGWNSEGPPDPNCYGAEKLTRVIAWFAEQGLKRDGAHVRFVSDSFTDGPLLDWADEAWFVTDSPRAARAAAARGWKPVDFSR